MDKLTEKLKYRKPDAELADAVSVLALAVSDPSASIEDFDSNVEDLFW